MLLEMLLGHVHRITFCHLSGIYLVHFFSLLINFLLKPMWKIFFSQKNYWCFFKKMRFVFRDVSLYFVPHNIVVISAKFWNHLTNNFFPFFSRYWFANPRLKNFQLCFFLSNISQIHRCNCYFINLISSWKYVFLGRNVFVSLNFNS